MKSKSTIENMENRSKWSNIAKQFLKERTELLKLLNNKSFLEAKEILKKKISLDGYDKNMFDFNYGCAAYTLFKNPNGLYTVLDDYELWDDLIDIGDMIPNIKLQEIKNLAKTRIK